MLNKIKARAKILKKEIFALYLVYKRKDTPILAKVFTIVIVAYALSPIDLIPDFIPILGYVDDLILLPIGITLAIKLIPANIMKECRREAEVKLKDKVPEAKIAGIVIAIIWVTIFSLIIYKLFITYVI